MSIASLILANLDSAPFSAAVFPTAIYRERNTGTYTSEVFTATPSGVGPFTYLWSSDGGITPASPAASNTTYTINSAVATVGVRVLSCTVTDTSNGDTFVANFTVEMVRTGGRFDEN